MKKCSDCQVIIKNWKEKEIIEGEEYEFNRSNGSRFDFFRVCDDCYLRRKESGKGFDVEVKNSEVLDELREELEKTKKNNE